MMYQHRPKVKTYEQKAWTKLKVTFKLGKVDYKLELVGNFLSGALFLIYPFIL